MLGLGVSWLHNPQAKTSSPFIHGPGFGAAYGLWAIGQQGNNLRSTRSYAASLWHASNVHVRFIGHFICLHFPLQVSEFVVMLFTSLIDVCVCFFCRFLTELLTKENLKFVRRRIDRARVSYGTSASAVAQ